MRFTAILMSYICSRNKEIIGILERKVHYSRWNYNWLILTNPIEAVNGLFFIGNIINIIATWNWYDVVTQEALRFAEAGTVEAKVPRVSASKLSVFVFAEMPVLAQLTSWQADCACLQLNACSVLNHSPALQREKNTKPITIPLIIWKLCVIWTVTLEGTLR